MHISFTFLQERHLQGQRAAEKELSGEARKAEGVRSDERKKKKRSILSAHDVRATGEKCVKGKRRGRGRRKK